jgi:hypothetical protein
MATSTQALPIYNQPQVDTGRGQGLIRVLSNADLDEQERVQREAESSAEEMQERAYEDALASYIRNRMTDMRNFRNSTGISERLLHALRTYKGEYSADMLQDIRQFGGSEVYARVTATKCRAATALLRDVYLGAERPWDIDPTPHPSTPADIDAEIQRLVNIEVSTMLQSGVKVDPQMIEDRVKSLRKAAERAAKKVAITEADRSAERLDDILTEGGFYQAFAEFLIDLPIFPYAVIKGPVVRKKEQTKWIDGQPMRESVPKMYFDRVSPFDLYWSPGASHVRQADFVERIQLSRAELSQCKGLPGYNEAAIDEVLERSYMDGLHEWWDTIDTERAQMEDRERWARQSSSLIDTAEFTGYVSGRLLLDWGMDPSKVPDPNAEYFVTAWMIDRWVIKAQINRTTNNRPPYYISSFEKVPGAMIGQGLPDLLEDVQTVCNAAARSLVNNASIASGPQVIVNDEVIDPSDDDELYPWKRWHVSYDPALTSSGQQPVSFFQPNMNAQELMGIYEKWNMMGDEISAIPRYMTGNEKVGGAGRTASGLAMLMGNASKTLQNVAASVDRDVIDPLLKELFDMVMLTQPGVFKGDELIVVKGVNHAVKREQDRMRQLEFLQLTANPIDMAIVGPEGRANVLRSVAQNLGLEHERVLPDDEEIRANLAMQQAQAAQQQQPGAVPPEQGGDPNQTPGPREQRAGPEAAREEVEGDFTGPTGRPGMRAGG